MEHDTAWMRDVDKMSVSELREEVIALRAERAEITGGLPLQFEGAHFTKANMVLLTLLYRASGTVVTKGACDYWRDEIGLSGWGSALNVSFSHLRKALRRAGFSDGVENVWGVGYRLTPALLAELRAREIKT